MKRSENLPSDRKARSTRRCSIRSWWGWPAVSHTATLQTYNRFGLTATRQPGRNEVYSVFLSKSATNNIIGPGNVLTNSPVGVRISDPGTDANKVTQNSTYNNDWLGIDLDPFFQVNANLSSPRSVLVARRYSLFAAIIENAKIKAWNTVQNRSCLRR